MLELKICLVNLVSALLVAPLSEGHFSSHRSKFFGRLERGDYPSKQDLCKYMQCEYCQMRFDVPKCLTSDSESSEEFCQFKTAEQGSFVCASNQETYR
jgi:hypothetical protein